MLPTLVVHFILHSIYLYILFISLRRQVFKLSFDTIHTLTSFVIVEKTVFEVGKETHISLILSSETFWLQAIEVFLVACVTLYKYGCMRLEEREEELRVLRLCLLEQN